MTAAEAIDALARGDASFWAGDRPAAVVEWRAALRGAGACEEDACRAVSAMAHVRLVRREGNFAPLWHEPGWNRALGDCPAEEPLCVLAEADRRLTVPAFAGGDVASVAGLVAPLLVEGSPWAGAAAARQRLAVARGAPGIAVEWPSQGDDGLARAMKASARSDAPDPGTWTLSFGLTAAPYAGFGGLVRLVEPDLGGRGHRLSLVAAADSTGTVAASSSLAVRSAASPSTSLGYGRGPLWSWSGEGAQATLSERADCAIGVATSVGPITVSGGAGGLWFDPRDTSPERVVGVGPTASVRFADRPTRWWISISGRDIIDADTAGHHLLVDADVRKVFSIGRLDLASRLYGQGAPGETAWYLEPAVGGSTLLRGLPYGRFRAEWIAAAQVEARVPVVGPLHAALFVDSVWADGFHASVGGGIRLVLPPERENVTRVDVGFSPDGWGVVLGWGEAF
ncbi:MAG: hypothetical protein EXR71_06510 [Myxococcales bacterium]|nr:hypothetical protein [Myxococcales bacterium]